MYKQQLMLCARRDTPDEELNCSGIEMEIYQSLGGGCYLCKQFA